MPYTLDLTNVSCLLKYTAVSNSVGGQIKRAAVTKNSRCPGAIVTARTSGSPVLTSTAKAITTAADAYFSRMPHPGHRIRLGKPAATIAHRPMSALHEGQHFPLSNVSAPVSMACIFTAPKRQRWQELYQSTFACATPGQRTSAP